MIRLFLPLAEAPGARVDVQGERQHYLVRVLRLAVGDALEVFDGRGARYPARVNALGDGHATLELGPRAEGDVFERHITLVQGLPKGDKLELVLQKGTELGASAFLPVATERSVVKLAAERATSKQTRWQRIVEEAARQCGRSDVPPVHAPVELLEGVTQLSAATRVLLLDEEERALPLSQAAPVLAPSTPLALVIGPEGGLARREVAALEARGAVAVTLGRRVLRTETAALAALAVLRHLEGSLG